MALTTYSELQSAVANWLARDDLTTYIPDFITLFEACANRRLRVRQQEAQTTLTLTDGSATLPTDYLAWRRATLSASTRIELAYVEPSYLQALSPTSAEGTPSHFTIEGTSFKARPQSDDSIEFLYFEKIDALSGTVNWLFSAHPDIYLFGALAEAGGFNVNSEQHAVWIARRDAAFDEIERLSNKTRGAGAVRVMGATP